MHHHGLIRITIALLCAISTSTTTIAEEALPVVQPKRAAVEAIAPNAPGTVLSADALTVDLPAEPLRDFERVPMTLAEAARANDYAAFDAAYRRDTNPAYRELHALWTFSVNDPVGGFYGTAMHDRLARAYPRYAAYIENFRIVDRNGNVFYPSAETRAFLTEEAMAGVVPREAAPRETVAGFRLPVSAPKRESVKVAVKPQAKAQTVAKPAPAPAVEPAPFIAQAPAAAPVVAAPAKPSAPSAQPAVRKPATGNRQPSVASSATARGILLIIIGLLGIGALTMMLRMPAEDLPPVERVEPPVPFKKAGGESPAEPRATGSHG